jgi:hypothetical protein
MDYLNLALIKLQLRLIVTGLYQTLWGTLGHPELYIKNFSVYRECLWPYQGYYQRGKIFVKSYLHVNRIASNISNNMVLYFQTANDATL